MKMVNKCEISYQEWLVLWEAFQSCLRDCTNAWSAGQDQCTAEFPVPPNDNISPALVCYKFNELNHLHCIGRCSVDYRASVCFEGRPDSPEPSSVSEEVQGVKDAARDALVSMIGLGIAVGLGGGGMVGLSKTALPAGAKRALEAGGRLTLATGGVIGGIGALSGLIASDPPDPQFQEMARLRPITLDALLPPGSSGLPFGEVFGPMASWYLQAFLHLEAFLISLEKSAGAREAADADKEMAHMRVAREYARGFAESLGEAAAARAGAAAELENVLAEAGDSDDGDRIMIDLGEPSAPGIPVPLRAFSRIRRSVTLALQDAIDLHAEWTSGTLDETISRTIDALASEKYGRSDYLAAIAEFVPSLEFFDRSPSALLAHPVLSATESLLASSLAKFADPA